MTLGLLIAAIGQDHATIVERLKDLEAGHRISLTKYSAGNPELRDRFSGDTAFFYHESFLIEILPQGRRYFEELEQEAAKDAQKRLVFISYGQCTPEEIQLRVTISPRVDLEYHPFLPIYDC